MQKAKNVGAFVIQRHLHMPTDRISRISYPVRCTHDEKTISPEIRKLPDFCAKMKRRFHFVHRRANVIAITFRIRIMRKLPDLSTDEA